MRQNIALFLIISFIIVSISSCKNDDPKIFFISKWDIQDDGFYLTIHSPDKNTHTLLIDWGDGKQEFLSNDDTVFKLKHSYYKSGEYIIAISDNLLIPYTVDFRSSNKGLIDVIQWGGMRLYNAPGQFMDFIKLKGFATTDILDTSNVTDMSDMFHGASNFYGDLSSWDTSNVTDMNNMFYNAIEFDGDLSIWNTSNVTDMSQMFNLAYKFNGDLSKWDTSNVTNMSLMFFSTFKFNGDLSKWDTSNVTNMSLMFFSNKIFNGDLSKWDTSNVTNMNGMFFYATAFDSDLSRWDTSSVTDMEAMFRKSLLEGNEPAWYKSE